MHAIPREAITLRPKYLVMIRILVDLGNWARSSRLFPRPLAETCHGRLNDGLVNTLRINAKNPVMLRLSRIRRASP